MGELVQFRPRGENAVNTGVVRPQRPAEFKSDTKSASIDKKGKSRIVVPSLDVLYDETKIKLVGVDEEGEASVSLADLRADLISSPQYDESRRKEQIEKLETHLAASRATCIVENIPRGEERKRAMIDLGKLTYSTALDMGFDSLRGMAIQILIKAVGGQEAYVITENIRIKRDLEKGQIS